MFVESHTGDALRSLSRKILRNRRRLFLLLLVPIARDGLAQEKHKKREGHISPPSHPFPRNTIKSAPKKMSGEGEEGKTAEAKKEEEEPEKSSKINFPLRFLGAGDVIRLPSLPHLL